MLWGKGCLHVLTSQLPAIQLLMKKELLIFQYGYNVRYAGQKAAIEEVQHMIRRRQITHLHPSYYIVFKMSGGKIAHPGCHTGKPLRMTDHH